MINLTLIAVATVFSLVVLFAGRRYEYKIYGKVDRPDTYQRVRELLEDSHEFKIKALEEFNKSV